MSDQKDVFRLDDEGLKFFCLTAFEAAKGMFYSYPKDEAASKVQVVIVKLCAALGLGKESFPTIEQLQKTIDHLEAEGYVKASEGSKNWFSDETETKLRITDKGQVELAGTEVPNFRKITPA